MSLLRSHNNKTSGGLGRVCATGMYRSIEHVKFPKFQTGIFGEWKAPIVFPVFFARCLSHLFYFKLSFLEGFRFAFINSVFSFLL